MFSWENIEMFDGKFFLCYCYCFLNVIVIVIFIVIVIVNFRKILDSATASSLLVQISIHSYISAGTPLATMLKIFKKYIEENVAYITYMPHRLRVETPFYHLDWH